MTTLDVSQPMSGWLKAAAAENVDSRLVTRAMFHDANGWLNANAPEKVVVSVVTRAVSHTSAWSNDEAPAKVDCSDVTLVVVHGSGRLNDLAPSKVDCNVVVLLRSQLLTSPLKAKAPENVDCATVHACTQSREWVSMGRKAYG